MENNTKMCPRCKTVKPYSEFGKGVDTVAGTKAHCRKCNSEEVSRWRTGHFGYNGRLANGRKEAKRLNRRNYPVSAVTLLKTLQKKGLQPLICAYTGEHLNQEYSASDPLSLTLDHVQPLSRPKSKGHQKGNIVPCSRAFNNFKRNRHFAVALADWFARPENKPKDPSGIEGAYVIVGCEVSEPVTVAVPAEDPSELTGVVESEGEVALC